MLLLNFWPRISGFPLAAQTFGCLGRLILYIIPCVLVLLPIRLLTPVPAFVFRKLLHLVAFTCFSVMLLGAESWQAPALASLILAAAIYPLLAMAEDASWYDRLFVQKSPGEIKRSLLMLFGMFAAVIALAWGLFGKPYAAAASILMWGCGDAAAALVGIPLGRHKVLFPPVNRKKSWEGSLAMLFVSFAAGAFLFIRHCGYPAIFSLSLTLPMALLGTAAELVSSSEWDTITVPAAMLALALILL